MRRCQALCEVFVLVSTFACLKPWPSQGTVSCPHTLNQYQVSSHHIVFCHVSHAGLYLHLRQTTYCTVLPAITA